MLSFHPDTFHPDGSHSDSGSAPPLHPAAVITPDAAITSGCHHFTPRCDILLPPTFHPDVHIRNSDAGWERKAFQIPRMDVSEFSYSPLPGWESSHFSQVLRCSPKASWYLPPTFWHILRYFASDICCLKSPKSPCNSPIIGFLSY